MNRVFADTHYFIAFLSRRDRHHAAARYFAKQQTVMTVTTTWVIVEVADAYSKAILRPRFAQFLAVLTADPMCFVVPCSQLDLDAGINLYLSRPDKEWSLTDCISFEVMRREGLTHALTGDHHFRQAGFTIEFP